MASNFLPTEISQVLFEQVVNMRIESGSSSYIWNQLHIFVVSEDGLSATEPSERAILYED